MDNTKLKEILDEDNVNGGVDINYRRYVDYKDHIIEEDSYKENLRDIYKQFNYVKSESKLKAFIKVFSYNNLLRMSRNINNSINIYLVQLKDKGLKEVLKPLLLSLSFIMMFIFTLYSSIAYGYYSNKFLPATIINGFDCSNKTIDFVYSKFQSKIDNYKFSIYIGDIEADVVSGEEISLKMENMKELLTDACYNQRKLDWFSNIFEEREPIFLDDAIEFDEERLNKFFDSAVSLSVSATVESENASIIYNGNEFEIIPETYGDRLDINTVKALITSKIHCLDSSIDITKEQCYIQPAIKASDKNIIDALENANSCLDKTISITVLGEKTILGSDIFGKWISVNSNAVLEGNIGMISEYVKSIDEQFTSANKTRSFMTSYGKLININGGDYGRQLNQASLVEQLSVAVKQTRDVGVVAEFSSYALGDKENDIGKSYIEIDLTNQRLWLYLDGEKVMNTDIVSGKPSTLSKEGTFVLTDMATSLVLSKEDNKGVSYYLKFGDGYGVCATNEVNVFGGSEYINAGTNGSIFLSNDSAKMLYDRAFIDMPIVCYFYEVEDSGVAIEDVPIVPIPGVMSY